VDPHLTPAFYKRLTAIATSCDVPRYQVIKEGIELFLERHKQEQGLLAKKAKDKGTEQQARQLLSKISKGYWESLSEEEKRARGQRAALARWAKSKPVPNSE
jgi:hypothetical protein